jgi:hypothetical protein
MQSGSEFPLINSHNNWGKLEEVWLGDVYPAAWYDHLESEVRDCFQEITERTQQDLNVIEKKLNEFNVIVRRPRYDHIDDYITKQGPTGIPSLARDTEQLIKPEITPRDYYVTINNTLFATRKWNNTKSPWQHIIDEYTQQGGDVQHSILDIGQAVVNGANTVRAGRDIYLDANRMNTQRIPAQEFFDQVQQYANTVQKRLWALCPENRIHILNNGGHTDGCFALLKPGVLLATRYFTAYEKTFPGWDRIETGSPEFSKHYRQRVTNNNYNGRWWVPDMKPSRAFNEHIIKHAQTWIGDYTETFFEVNCLVIDEKNVLVLGEHEAIFRKMEEYGITAHPIPFRTRTFWDGGMHCLTLDIRRQTKLEDFFPERGDNPGTILIEDPSTSNPVMTKATELLQDKLKNQKVHSPVLK